MNVPALVHNQRVGFEIKIHGDECVHIKYHALEKGHNFNMHLLSGNNPRYAPMLNLTEVNDGDGEHVTNIQMFRNITKFDAKKVNHNNILEIREDKNLLLSLILIAMKDHYCFTSHRKLESWMKGNIHGLTFGRDIRFSIYNYHCMLQIRSQL